MVSRPRYELDHAYIVPKSIFTGYCSRSGARGRQLFRRGVRWLPGCPQHGWTSFMVSTPKRILLNSCRGFLSKGATIGHYYIPRLVRHWKIQNSLSLSIVANATKIQYLLATATGVFSSLRTLQTSMFHWYNWLEPLIPGHSLLLLVLFSLPLPLSNNIIRPVIHTGKREAVCYSGCATLQNSRKLLQNTNGIDSCPLADPANNYKLHIPRWFLVVFTFML